MNSGVKSPPNASRIAWYRPAASSLIGALWTSNGLCGLTALTPASLPPLWPAKLPNQDALETAMKKIGKMLSFDFIPSSYGG